MEEREFEWESQLRFYWEQEPDTLMVQQCTGKFGFGYEYMGLNGRLVITPLTDRIYLTMTQALSMRLGGAPAGPAGTGKTETVKDLAKAMGLLCVVTNCGEGMDYKVGVLVRLCVVIHVHKLIIMVLILLTDNWILCVILHVDILLLSRLLVSCSQGCASVGPGVALTSSTGLTSQCSLLSQRKSRPSRMQWSTNTRNFRYRNTNYKLK